VKRARLSTAFLAAAILAAWPASSTVAQTTTETISIDIAPGDAAMLWLVDGNAGHLPCSSTASLRREGAPAPLRSLWSVSLADPSHRAEEGRAPLDGVAPGRYVVEITGTCLYLVTVEPTEAP
jgi:hypothetical protein